MTTNRKRSHEVGHPPLTNCGSQRGKLQLVGGTRPPTNCGKKRGKLQLVGGQALLELAVFGALALAALGFLIRVGMSMNYDQEVRMAAFRRALAAAHEDNGTDKDAVATLYYMINNRQMPNPSDGHMTLPRGTSEASAFVEWGDRLTMSYDKDANKTSVSPLGRETQPRIIVRSDNAEREFRQEDFPDDEVLVNNDDGTVTHIAFRGIVSKATMTNTSNATIVQTATNTSLQSGTTTCSTTTLNTKAQDTIGSCVNGGAGTVNW